MSSSPLLYSMLKLPQPRRRASTETARQREAAACENLGEAVGDCRHCYKHQCHAEPTSEGPLPILTSLQQQQCKGAVGVRDDKQAACRGVDGTMLRCCCHAYCSYIGLHRHLHECGHDYCHLDRCHCNCWLLLEYCRSSRFTYCLLLLFLLLLVLLLLHILLRTMVDS